MQDEMQFELTKAEMGEVREENQRLRVHLDRIMKEYQTLQKKFQDIFHQQQTTTTVTTMIKRNDKQQTDDESDLVSLSLGRTSSIEPIKKDKRCSSPPTKSGEGLDLALECGKFEPSSTTQNESSVIPSPDDSSEETKDETPQKPSTPKRNGEDQDVLQQTPAKKTRVSVRVRCDTPTVITNFLYMSIVKSNLKKIVIYLYSVTYSMMKL